MSKTFEQIVQETLAATQAQNRMLAASTGSSPSTRIFRHALAAFEVAREPDPAPELVARIVDAVRAELAAEEAAPAELAASVSGLRGSPARVAAELRQLAEKVESGWLGTSSCCGCDVSVKRAGEKEGTS